MGINFSDGCECESLIGDNPCSSTKSKETVQDSPSYKPNGDCSTEVVTTLKQQQNINNKLVSSSPSSFTSSNHHNSSLIIVNDNFVNNNNNATDLTDVSPNYAEAVRNINLIREEIRLRRSLFFSSPPPESQDSPLLRSITNNNIDSMSVKTIAGFKEKGAGSSSSRYTTVTSYRTTATSGSPSKLNGPAQRDSTMEITTTTIPKLYSVQSNQQQHPVQQTSSHKSTTHSALPVASSRLPVFSSGQQNLRSNNGSMLGGKMNNNQRSVIHPRIPQQQQQQPLRTAKYLVETTIVDEQRGSTAGQWISGNEFFSRKDSQASNQHEQQAEIRRETLPSKFGAASGGNEAAVVPGGYKLLQDSSSNNEIRRGSVYTNWGSKLPMYNSVVKKPAETVPFYMMGLYKNRNSEAGTSTTATTTYNISRPPTGTTTAATVTNSRSIPFSAVSTGVVKQRAIQYQTKISQLSSTGGSEPASPPSPLVRSSTYVKSTDPPTADSNTPVIPDLTDKSSSSSSTTPASTKVEASKKNMRKSLPAGATPSSRPSRPSLGGNSKNNSGSCSSDNKENRLSIERDIRKSRNSNSSACKTNLSSNYSCEVISSNFPLARDASTSSSVVSGEEASSVGSSYATADADKAISDSEFLIDDEISDQPELTLTFKDSSLILSPSSSGESLISCDLMLDYKESSCSGRGVPGDSVCLVDEPSLVGSPKQLKERTKAAPESKNTSLPAAATTTTGGGQTNMVNTTSANSSRRSLAMFQGRNNNNNGTISPIPSPNTSPLAFSNKLATSRSSSQNRSSQPNLQNERLYHPSNHQSHGGHIPRRSSGLPVPVTPEKDEACKSSENHNHHLHNSISGSPNSRLRHYSSSRSPLRQSLGTARNRTVSPSPKALKQRAREESFKVCKEVQQENSQPEATSDSGSTDDGAFMQEVLVEVTEYKSKLKELLTLMETTERELDEKDQVIAKQKKEIEYWKGRALEREKGFEDSSCDDDSIIIHTDDYSEDGWRKEKQRSRRKETVNSAAQTENNYSTKPAVTYPEANDQVGQLVSFRIGRSSAASNTS